MKISTSHVSFKSGIFNGLSALVCNHKIYALRIVAIMGLVTGMILSLSLWLGPRTVPTAPLFSSLNNIPQSISSILFFVTIGFLSLSIVYMKKKRTSSCGFDFFSAAAGA